MNHKLPVQIAVLASVPTSAIAQNDPGYYGHMMGWGSGMLWGPLAWIFWIGIVIIVVLIGLRLVGGRDSRGGASEDESLRILKNRYARGEIDKEQYEQMRRDLER